MAKILIKRGLITNLANLTLDEGELALAYNEDKSSIELYAGDGNGGKILVNPDTIVPTKLSELINDSGYQTAEQVQAAIAAIGHASFEVADSVPAAEAAADNVFYLVKNDDTGYYDIYAKVSGEVVRLDDTTVDLTGYIQSPDGGTEGQVLKKKADGTLEWADDNDTTYSEATTAAAGLMSAADKTKLDNTQTVSEAEKTMWNAKLDSSSTIDGGTF